MKHVILILILAASVVAAQSKKKAEQPDTVILKETPVMGGVKLMHKLHVERVAKKCETCHHASKPAKANTAPQQACRDCHTKTAAAPMKTKLQAAFHNPTAQAGNCITCHKTENAKGKKAPVKCAECHRKENV